MRSSQHSLTKQQQQQKSPTCETQPPCRPKKPNTAPTAATIVVALTTTARSKSKTIPLISSTTFFGYSFRTTCGHLFWFRTKRHGRIWHCWHKTATLANGFIPTCDLDEVENQYGARNPSPSTSTTSVFTTYSTLPQSSCYLTRNLRAAIVNKSKTDMPVIYEAFMLDWRL